MSLLSVVFLGIVALAHSVQVNPAPKFMYDIKLDIKPAFVKVMKNSGKFSSYGTDSFDLGVTSFTGNIFKKDHVLNVAEVSEYDVFDPLMTDKNTLTEELQWPNEIDLVPEEVFDRRVMTVASGFFLAGKDNGTVALIDVDDINNPVLHYLAPFDQNGKKWFYHRVMWTDMNSDGHLDAVTARAWGAGDHAEEAQLLWLENPGFSYPTGNWNEHIIHEGTIEVSFNLHKLELPTGEMTPVIIGSGFWSKELTLIWSSSNNWLDSDSIQTLVVGNYGWYFDVQVVDVNNDGRLDLLTTTWSQLGDPGALIAYEIPNDWQDLSKWNSHIIRDGYKDFPLPGKGSPGTAVAFWPDLKNTDSKPYIFVSGDDSGNYFVESPTSEDANDWSYETTLVYEQRTGTVGSFSIADVNDDGFAEIFMAVYEQSFVRVMSYEQ